MGQTTVEHVHVRGPDGFGSRMGMYLERTHIIVEVERVKSVTEEMIG